MRQRLVIRETYAVVWLIYLLLLAASGIAGYRLLPSDLRFLISENCRDRRGHLRVGYTARELASVIQFYGWMFLIVWLVAGAMLLALLWVNNRWVPLEIVVEAAARFHPHPDVWRERLMASGDVAASSGDLVQRHTQWLQQRGTSREEARQIQSLLWRGVPLVLLLSVLGGVTGLRWFARALRKGVEQLAEDANGRRTARLTARYLQDSGQLRQQVSKPRTVAR